MRFVVTTVLLLAAVGAGQWLECTILLPDSLAAISGLTSPLFSPANNSVNVFGSSALSVVDAATGARTARVPVGGADRSCYAPEYGKLYCGSHFSGTVAVLDIATNRQVGTIQVGARWSNLCYNPAAGKVYVIPYAIGDSMSIVRCSDDSIVGHISVGNATSTIACSPAENKVYCSDLDKGAIAVISGDNDSLADSVPAGGYARTLLHNPVTNRLYGIRYPDTLLVVDCASDSVVRLVGATTCHYLRGLNPARNKIYGAGESYERLKVFCGYGDTLLADVAGVRPRAIAWDSADDVVYVADSYDGMKAVDGLADTLLAVSGRAYGTTLCWSPVGNRVYCPAGSELLVFDAAARALTDSFDYWTDISGIALNTARQRMYCADSVARQLLVIDEEQRGVVRNIALTRPPTALCYNPANDRLYCPDMFGAMTVVACGGDSIVGTIGTTIAGGQMALRPAENKLYCLDQVSHYLAVIDCSGDTLLRRLSVSTTPTALLYHPERDQLYVSIGDGSRVWVYDCAADTLLASVSTGAASGPLCRVGSGDKVCCAVPASNFVAVIDCAALQRERTVRVGTEPGAMAYSPLQNALYCSTVEGPSIAVVDCSTWTVAASVPVEGQVRAMVYDSLADRLYCAGPNSSTIAVLDCASNEVTATFQLVIGPKELVWSPARRRVYVASHLGSSIAVLRDTLGGGVGERGQCTAPHILPGPAVVRNSLVLDPRDDQATLVDATGRRVLALLPGANDVSRLSPGVYFACAGARSRRVLVVH